VLAPYVGFESVKALLEAERPDVSWLGIALSTSSLVVMPYLGLAKQRLADQPRLSLTLAVCAGVAALGPAAAIAAPPPVPPGCTTVLTTPAVGTGAMQGIAGKNAAYDRVCLS
jgi:hypothetical protein